MDVHAQSETSRELEEHQPKEQESLESRMDRLEDMLEREGRSALAEAAFSFIPARADLDLTGFDDIDIFSHA